MKVKGLWDETETKFKDLVVNIESTQQKLDQLETKPSRTVCGGKAAQKSKAGDVRQIYVYHKQLEAAAKAHLWYEQDKVTALIAWLRGKPWT